MANDFKRYLGVDWGESRIGLALADSITKVATPFKVVNSPAEVRQIALDENIDILIIGKPLPLDGGQVRNPKFIEFLNMVKSWKIAYELVDERFSSKEAQKLFANNNDTVAAMLILNNYLQING